MIKPVTFGTTANMCCKKNLVKNIDAQKFDLPIAKNLTPLSYDKLDKKGPFCGIDQCAI